jgi:LysM repeat protein
VDARRRSELARYGAPAAFLAAATIAILLIKAGLSGSGGGDTAPTVEARPTTTATTTTPPAKKVTVTPVPATTTGTTTSAGEYYTVESGDTLGSIAAKYSTSVGELMQLNPGIDPTALRIGQKIRVS